VSVCLSVPSIDSSSDLLLVCRSSEREQRPCCDPTKIDAELLVCVNCACSAKELLPGESNVAYICSRYYRAPELILGATDYTIQIGWLYCTCC